jgi:THAP domain
MEWIQTIHLLNNQKDLCYMNIHRKAKICSKHFQDSSMYVVGSSFKRLKPGAVPSLFPNIDPDEW